MAHYTPVLTRLHTFSSQLAGDASEVNTKHAASMAEAAQQQQQALAALKKAHESAKQALGVEHSQELGNLSAQVWTLFISFIAVWFLLHPLDACAPSRPSPDCHLFECGSQLAALQASGSAKAGEEMSRLNQEIQTHKSAAASADEKVEKLQASIDSLQKELTAFKTKSTDL